MTEIALDFARITAAVISGGVSLACLRLAWAVWRYSPTQQEVSTELRRRSVNAAIRSAFRGQGEAK